MSALWPDSGSNAKVHAKAAEVVGKVDETAKEMELVEEARVCELRGLASGSLRQLWGGECGVLKAHGEEIRFAWCFSEESTGWVQAASIIASIALLD